MFEFKVKHIETGEIYTVYFRDDENDKPAALYFLIYMYGEWDYFQSCWFVPVDSELDERDGEEATDSESDIDSNEIASETDDKVQNVIKKFLLE